MAISVRIDNANTGSVILVGRAAKFTINTAAIENMTDTKRKKFAPEYTTERKASGVRKHPCIKRPKPSQNILISS